MTEVHIFIKKELFIQDVVQYSFQLLIYLRKYFFIYKERNVIQSSYFSSIVFKEIEKDLNHFLIRRHQKIQCISLISFFNEQHLPPSRL